MVARESALNPIDVDILWARLISIIDEASTTLVRSSFSTAIREARDYTCIFMDETGRSIVQPTSTLPPFVGTMPRTMRAFLAAIPLGEWNDGDVVITNDPWLGTGHLNDVNIALPVFHGGRIIGFAGIVAHMVDIGGKLWSAVANDVYEEGLQIPVTKIVERHRDVDLVMQFIRRNVRMNDVWMGDLRAMIAAGNAVRSGICELVDEVGIDFFRTATEAIVGRCRMALETAVAGIPEGTYHSSVTMDGYEEPLTIHAAITIARKKILVDYAGSALQVPYGINSPYCYTYAFTVYPLKALLTPEVPNNEGTQQVIEVTAPQGSIVNPVYPAAVGGRNLTGHVLYSAIFGALKDVLPDRVLADCGAPRPTIILGGQTPDGRPFRNMFFLMGGLGAKLGKDGPPCLPFPTNVAATPVEVLEQTTPIRVENKTLIADSGGAGRYRGGCAQELTIRNVSGHPLQLSILAERTKHLPRGLFGGADGGRPRFERQSSEPLNPKGVNWLAPDEAVTIRTHGGGGYGDPRQRDRALVAKDVLEGYVTPASARSVYGTDLD
jgi:N-methylhydantoinase B